MAVGSGARALLTTVERTVTKFHGFSTLRMGSFALRSVMNRHIGFQKAPQIRCFLALKKVRPAPGEEQCKVFKIKELGLRYEAFHVLSTLGRSSTRFHSSRGTTCAYRAADRGSRQLPVATSP